MRGSCRQACGSWLCHRDIHPAKLSPSVNLIRACGSGPDRPVFGLRPSESATFATGDPPSFATRVILTQKDHAHSELSNAPVMDRGDVAATYGIALFR